MPAIVILMMIIFIIFLMMSNVTINLYEQYNYSYESLDNIYERSIKEYDLENVIKNNLSSVLIEKNVQITGISDLRSFLESENFLMNYEGFKITYNHTPISQKFIAKKESTGKLYDFYIFYENQDIKIKYSENGGNWLKVIINKNIVSTKRNRYLYEEIFEAKGELQKKNLNVVLLEEEFYIECVTIPRCRKRYIDSVVEIEVAKKFKEKDDILYNYSIVYKDKEKIKILINYIDSKNINCLRPLKKNLKINSVYPIQIIASKKIKRKVKKNIFIAVFPYEDILYGFTYYNNLILGTTLIRKDDTFEKIKDKLIALITLSKDIMRELNKDIPDEIYFFQMGEVTKKVTVNNIDEELKKIWGECYEIQI